MEALNIETYVKNNIQANTDRTVVNNGFYYEFIKRIIDVILAFIGLIVASPIMAIIVNATLKLCHIPVKK